METMFHPVQSILRWIGRGKSTLAAEFCLLILLDNVACYTLSDSSA
jgi:hypothetical protein